MSANCDIVKFWLNAAGRYPVLRTDQVLLLAKQIQSNSPESIIHQRAVEKLVRHNLKLIPKVARRAMRNKYGKNFGGNYTADVFQCGAMGLMRAAEKFDPTRGYAFSTYAVVWIYQAMQRNLYSNMSPIRIPENTIREYYSTFLKSKDPIRNIDLSANQRDRYMNAAVAIQCKSLDSYYTTNNSEEGFVEGLEVSSIYRNEATESIDEMLEMIDCSVLAKQMVIEYYEENFTLEQIGVKYKLSRSQVKRNIKICIDRLRESLSAV